MRRLVMVELHRLLARRLLKGLTVLLVLAFGVAGTLAFVASSDSPQVIAEARAHRQAAVASCISEIDAGTLNDEPLPSSAATDPPGFCREMNPVSDPRFDFSDFDWMLLGTGMPFVAIAWLLGASAMGAEWTHRTIVTTLTWEVRRHRVLLAKAVAVVIVAGVWIFALEAAFTVAMYPAAEFEGLTTGVDAGWWLDLASVGARIAGLGALGAVLGFALATIGRNTAAALGTGFVYLAVVESLVRVHKASWAEWLIGDNASLVLIGSEEVTHLGHSQAAAVALLLAYTCALVGLAALIFRRRDLS